MGSPETEAGRAPREGPTHRVSISQPFYLGACEVTQSEYERIMGVNPSWFSSTGLGKDSVVGADTQRYPVEQVSWEAATAFCKRLGQRDKKAYRLPTEAEWEHACRAGSTSPFSFGENPVSSDVYAWYLKNSRNSTWPVGLKTPNAFGLYDVHGNVWEWCQDWIADDYYAASLPVDPAGPPAGTFRSLRGGSWGNIASQCRSAARSNREPEFRDRWIGFRVVQTPDKAPTVGSTTPPAPAANRPVAEVALTGGPPRAVAPFGASNSPTSSARARGEPSSIADTIDEIIAISAKSNEGYVLGPVRKGQRVTLSYVSGKWKGWGRYATESPDAKAQRAW